MNLSNLLTQACDLNASDLHLSAGHAPTVRVDGDLNALPNAPVLTNKEISEQLPSIIPHHLQTSLNTSAEIDFSFEHADLNTTRFRVNIFNQHHGLSAAFRLIPKHPPSLEMLKLPEALKSLCKTSSGLILITGTRRVAGSQRHLLP